MGTMGASEWLLVLNWLTGGVALFFLCALFLPPIAYWIGSVYVARAMAQQAAAAEFTRVRTVMRSDGLEIGAPAVQTAAAGTVELPRNLVVLPCDRGTTQG